MVGLSIPVLINVSPNTQYLKQTPLLDRGADEK